MDILRHDTYESRNGQIDTDIFEQTVEIDGEEQTIEIIGWSGIADSDDDWNIYPALTPEGETKYIAVPDSAATSLSLASCSGEMIWKQFLNYGDDWHEADMFVPVQEKVRTLDINELSRKLNADKNTEMVKCGEHCLQMAEELLTEEEQGVLYGIIGSYKDFMEDIEDIVRREGTCYFTGENAEFYHGPSEDPSVTPYRLDYSNVRLDKADVEAEWDKELGENKALKDSVTHTLKADVKLQQYVNGKWIERKTVNNVTIADIPAMNYKNGLFKNNKNLYAILTQTMENGRKAKTPGMSLTEALEKGVYSYCKTVAKQLAQTSKVGDYAYAKVLEGVNMNDGFKELFSSSGSEEKDGDEDLIMSYDSGYDDVNLEKKEFEEEIFYDEKDKEHDKEKKEAEKEKTAKLPPKAQKPEYELSGRCQYAKDNNIIPRDALTVKILSCMPYISGVKKDGVSFYKKVAPNTPSLYQSYWLDAHAAPEGRNAPFTGRLTRYVKFDRQGNIYKAVVRRNTVDDGKKPDKKDVVWMRVFCDNPFDTSADVLENHVYGRAGDFHEDGTLKSDRHGKIITQKGGISKYSSRNEIEYISFDPRADHTAGFDIQPFMNVTDGVRLLIAMSQAKDFITTTETQGASLFKTMENTLGKDYIHYAEKDGVIDDIEIGDTPFGKKGPVGMTVKYDDGETVKISLKYKDKLNSKTMKNEQPAYGIEVGVRVKKGDVLTDTQGMCSGTPTMGPYVLVAIIPATRESSTDDSGMISPELANKVGLAGQIMEKQKVEIVTNEAGTKYGPDFVYKPTERFVTANGKQYDTSNLDENGIIKNGTKIKKGDSAVLLWKAKADGTKTRTPGDMNAMEKPVPGQPFTKPDDYKDAPEEMTVNVKEDSYVYVDKVKSANGREKYEFTFCTQPRMKEGEKIAIGAHGVKNTVEKQPENVTFRILPSNNVASVFDNVAPQYLLAGDSKHNRKDEGLDVQALAGGLAAEKGILINPGVDTRYTREWLLDYYKANGLSPLKDIERKEIDENGEVHISILRGIVGLVPMACLNHDSEKGLTNEAKEMNFMMRGTAYADNMLNVVLEISAFAKKQGSITDNRSLAIMRKAGADVEVDPNMEIPVTKRRKFGMQSKAKKIKKM